MNSAEKALQTALQAMLAADPDVSDLLGSPLRLYAQRSRSAAYPNASWGRVERQDRSADQADLGEYRLTLDVWCRDQDPHDLVGLLRSVLRRADITLPAPWRVLSVMPVYSDVFQTTHSRLRRGVIRLRALVAEEVGSSANGGQS